MRKTLLAVAVALLATVGVASAQDIQADRTGMYVGGMIGSTPQKGAQTDLGVVAGYQLHPNARVEAAFDNLWRNTGSNGQMLMVNAVAQYRIPTSVVTPYVLAGTGVGFNSFGTTNIGSAEMLYNVGAGVRFAVSRNVELDARYRYISHFNTSAANANANMLTVGANWRF
jgi:opacity protein-like surface antigen